VTADPEPTLDNAIAKLAHPFTVETMVRVTGGGRRMVRTAHQPLIAQLRDAIRSTTGANANGSSPQSRSVMDADAFAKYQELKVDLRASWLELPIPVNTFSTRWHPEDSLQAFREQLTVGEQAGAVPARFLTRQARIFNGWVHRIERKFTPPETVTNTKPCPHCGDRWAYDPSNGDRIYSIVVTVQPSQPGELSKSHAVCRGCGARWNGEVELRALARAQRALLGPRSDTPAPGA
jgi:hypothetical protein